MSNRNCGLRNLVPFCLAVGLFYTLAKAQDSVADAARKNRPKDTHTTTKRVWTNDDIASAGKKESTVPLTGIQESASETPQKFRLLGREELGAAVLKGHNAPNVDFPDRKDWEQKLFGAKQAWVDQVDRMVAPKDTNNYVLARIIHESGTPKSFFRECETQIDDVRIWLDLPKAEVDP